MMTSYRKFLYKAPLPVALRPRSVRTKVGVYITWPCLLT